MLWNADDPGMTLRYQAAADAAQQLGITVQPLGVREPEDFVVAFKTMVVEPPDGIFMVADALTFLNRRRVYEFAQAHRLPAIWPSISSARTEAPFMLAGEASRIAKHRTEQRRGERCFVDELHRICIRANLPRRV